MEKGIVMRHDSLRECTKKAAEKAKKLESRLSPGEKKDRKRMAQVAAVYTVQAHIRTGESIMKVSEDENIIPLKSLKKLFKKRDKETQIKNANGSY